MFVELVVGLTLALLAATAGWVLTSSDVVAFLSAICVTWVYSNFTHRPTGHR